MTEEIAKASALVGEEPMQYPQLLSLITRESLVLMLELMRGVGPGVRSAFVSK